jgi:hypothetical protein
MVQAKVDRMLDDAQRTAGIMGDGYPIRAGKDEIFYLSRLTKEIKNAYRAIVVGKAETALRESAALLPADEYAKDVRAFQRDKNSGAWSWGGSKLQETLIEFDGMAELTKLLLEHHHPGIDADTVEWLMALWVCPECGWRGVKPEDEPEKVPCCPRYECGRALESVMEQLGRGVRELSSADPRMPLPAAPNGDGGHAERTKNSGD